VATITFFTDFHHVLYKGATVLLLLKMRIITLKIDK